METVSTIESEKIIDQTQRSESEDARYQQHSQHLLSLFPKVVWDHICSFIDSSTFHNLNNSSPFFQKLFHKKRVLFLHKPVFKILLDHLCGTDSEFSRLRFLFIGQTDIALSFLTKNRSVCKTWKRTVDEMASIWSDDLHSIISLPQCLLKTNYEFQSLTTFNRFILKITDTHPSNANPFVGKYISLQLRGSRDPNLLEFSAKISTLFEKYGHHLKTCVLYLDNNYVHQAEPHHNIIKWLNYMPYLQNLRIKYTFQVDSNNLPKDKSKVLPIQPKNLRELIIETSNTDISAESIYNWSWMEHYNLGQLIRNQGKLEYLHLKIFNKEDIQILKDVRSPLKTLSAQYYCKQNDFNFSDLVISCCEKFSNSLEDLTIDYSETLEETEHIKMIHESFHGRLNLPKLRKFSIRILNASYTLDFLLGMQDNLEELIAGCISGSPESYEESAQTVTRSIGREPIVQFLGYQDKMLESNIWTLFPKLRTIWVTAPRKNTQFKRDDWIKKQKHG